jgi:hypothetical protein
VIECVDSIQSPQTTRQPIPAAVMQAPALLAYVAGNSWLTYGPYAAARPDLAQKGWIVSTTLTCLGRARCYDIEPGGGQNRNIGVFMRNADRSHGLPILYTFASNVAAMVAAAASFGYHQGRDYYVLAAHPNTSHGRHLCAPSLCGFPKADGTQYDFAGAIDRSILSDYMLPQPKPPPAPTYASGTFVATITYDHDHGKVTVSPQKGNVKRWGSVQERIRLELDLEVGDKNPRRGWLPAGRVTGRGPA